MGLKKPSFGRKRSAQTKSTANASEASSKIELSPKRKVTKEPKHEIFHTTHVMTETDRESDLTTESVGDGACCTSRSRCGCPDQIHETLLFVGKLLYDCCGDPPNAEAKDYVVGISEIGEQGATLDDATFCCWSRDQVLEEETKVRKHKKVFL